MPEGETSLKDELITALKAGKDLVIHECSLCGYRCGFRVQESELYYDNGCFCTGRYPTLRRRDWRDLDFYLDPARGHIPTLEQFVNQP